MDLIQVFLGYDARETVAFHVAAHSIHRHSSRPVSVAPLMLSQLARVFTRPRDAKQSTDFAFTRFLVPYLCGYQGWALFADSDILFQRDIAELWDLRDNRYAVQVVQRDHVPRESSKFLGHAQTVYPKKNWSSVMLFNNARCQALTLDYVHQATGLALHRFQWLEDETLVGALPHAWNHLVDYDDEVPAAEVANFHYTNGGPWFADCRQSGYAREWWDELKQTLAPLPAQHDMRLPLPFEGLRIHRAA